MKKIYINNSILSSDEVSNAIETANIIMTCNEDMEIEISEEDYNKLIKIIDESDIVIL